MFKKIRIFTLALVLGIMPCVRADNAEQVIVSQATSPLVEGLLITVGIVAIYIAIQKIRSRFASGAGSAVDPLTPNQTTIEPQDTQLISYLDDGLRSAILAAREQAGNPTDTSDIDTETFENFTTEYLVGNSSQTTPSDFKTYLMNQYPTSEGYTTLLSRVNGDSTKGLKGFGQYLEEFDELVLPSSYKGGLLDYVVNNNMGIYDMNTLDAWINNMPNLVPNYNTLNGQKYINDFVLQADQVDSAALKSFVENVRVASPTQTNYESINTINDMLTKMNSYSLPQMPAEVTYKGNLDFLIRNQITTPQMFTQLQTQVEKGGLLPVQYEPLTGPEGAYNTALASLKNSIAIDNSDTIANSLPEMIDAYQSFIKSSNFSAEDITAYTAKMQAAITQYSSTESYSGISYESMNTYTQMLNQLQTVLPESASMKSALDSLNNSLKVGSLTPDDVLSIISSGDFVTTNVPSRLSDVEVLGYKLSVLTNYVVKMPNAEIDASNIGALSSYIQDYNASIVSQYHLAQPLLPEGNQVNTGMANDYAYNAMQVKMSFGNMSNLISENNVVLLEAMKSQIEELESNIQGQAQQDEVNSLKEDYNNAVKQANQEDPELGLEPIVE